MSRRLPAATKTNVPERLANVARLLVAGRLHACRRFRTRGANSVATVRGTRWWTEDRCDGTLTRVRQGSVIVRNLRTGRRVIVRAGHSYLARGRR